MALDGTRLLVIYDWINERWQRTQRRGRESSLDNGARALLSVCRGAVERGRGRFGNRVPGACFEDHLEEFDIGELEG